MYLRSRIEHAYTSAGTLTYIISLMKAPNENEMKRFFFNVYVIIYCNDFQNKHFLLCDLVNFHVIICNDENKPSFLV